MSLQWLEQYCSDPLRAAAAGIWCSMLNVLEAMGVQPPSPSYTTTTEGCTYPVSPQSPPQCILQAFKDSGYFYLLTPQQQQQAASNPSAWLESHPYLYSAAPSFFSPTPSVSQQITPPPTQPNAPPPISTAPATALPQTGQQVQEDWFHELESAFGGVGHFITYDLPHALRSVFETFFLIPPRGFREMAETIQEYPIGSIVTLLLIIGILVFLLWPK